MLLTYLMLLCYVVPVVLLLFFFRFHTYPFASLLYLLRYVLSFVPGILCCCIYFEMEFAFDFIWSCPSYSVGKERERGRESVVRRQIMMDGFAVSCLCFIPISFSFCSALKHTILFYMIYWLLLEPSGYALQIEGWEIDIYKFVISSLRS